MSIRNAAGDRSYATSSWSTPTNTWERKEITIPGDTSGTWLYDNQHGCSVTWLLTCGSNFISTPNSWNAGNFLAGGTPANALDTIGNRFKLALVQIEEGIGASAV